MKARIMISYLMLLILLSACSHEIEKTAENNFTPPTVKSQPRLLYPKIAQEDGNTGSVKIIFTVLQDGTVEKAGIQKSSGYKILDDAALEYCKQIVFNPAERNGKQVSSRILWDINFNITDINMDANTYLIGIEHLYKKLTFAKNSDESRNIQRQILRMHNDFVYDMKDALGFNIVLRKTLSPKIVEEWKDAWDSWPLSFLLYHDFLSRFNDYDSIADVKMKLSQALNFDIRYIENTVSIDLEAQKAKEILLSKINDFIARKYPDIHIKKSI